MKENRLVLYTQLHTWLRKQTNMKHDALSVSEKLVIIKKVDAQPHVTCKDHRRTQYNSADAKQHYSKQEKHTLAICNILAKHKNVKSF
jgi:hypothetical protein